MKKIGYIIGFLWCCICTAPLGASAQSAEGWFTLRGVVRDAETRRPIENANVTVVNSNVGTVTNADGLFSLRIAADEADEGVRISHIGYGDARIASDRIAALKADTTVWLTPAALMVEAITVLGGDARRVVDEALKRIPSNYAAESNILSAFYRETIRKQNRYVSVSEAVAEIGKTDYSRRNVIRDRVQILKGRRLISQKKSDTLAVKVVGGPTLPIVLDVVKNEDVLFGVTDIDDYAFSMELPSTAGGRMQYVISFRPRVVRDYALYNGRIFIDSESLAFTRIEFELDMSDRQKATRAVLHKSPAGLRFRPSEVSYVVTYRQQGDRTYFNYIRNTIRFRCNWEKRMFAAAYTSCTEAVMVDRREGDAAIDRREAFGRNEIFYDKVETYWDEDYWRDYNIIEPTESLEQAVHRLRKQY